MDFLIRIILESILSIYEGSIALENHGSGMESLIKTRIALGRQKSKLNVILMEEPENHLSFANMHKMLNEITSKQEQAQMIIATHSSMIASRLNLNNVLWLTDGGVKSLAYVKEDVADFFVKADDNGFLQLLLAERSVLVEGATEFLLFPQIYKQETGRTIEEDSVAVISCNGISYKNYLNIAEGTSKKIAVLTDNDKKQHAVNEATEFNNSHENQHIFMGATDEDWTWEACFYRLNQKSLQSIITVKNGAKYLFHEKDYGQYLGYMLNHKVEVAYKMLKSEQKFNIPQYVRDAILWLNS